VLYRLRTIEYESAYSRRNPAKGAEGERDTQVIVCLETLRQKDYRRFVLWRDPSRLVGHRRGKPAEQADDLSGKKTEA